jgi:hypothetical protein
VVFPDQCRVEKCWLSRAWFVGSLITPVTIISLSKAGARYVIIFVIREAIIQDFCGYDYHPFIFDA